MSRVTPFLSVLFIIVMAITLGSCTGEDSGFRKKDARTFYELTSGFLEEIQPYIDQCGLANVEKPPGDIPSAVTDATILLESIRASPEGGHLHPSQRITTELLLWLAEEADPKQSAHSHGVSILYQVLSERQRMIKARGFEEDTIQGYLYFQGVWMRNLVNELGRVEAAGKPCLDQKARSELRDALDEYMQE